MSVSYTHLDVYKRQEQNSVHTTQKFENVISTDTNNNEWNDKGRKLTSFGNK